MIIFSVIKDASTVKNTTGDIHCDGGTYAASD
jgi:hypothetical protein